ncbi:hypothetical protein F2Q68_00015991 [Brassica cretica]|nr:hypothetical protein F2Q68_00015991 [Brassica cretica]
MAETDVSSTKDKPGWINGEHTDLKPAEVRVYELDELSDLSDTTLELDELSDTTLELNELSDTALELSELSDTEDGACLAAGRNGPCSAQGKVHKKCNMSLFLSKLDQPFPQSISSPFSPRMPRGSQQISHGRGLPRVLQRLVKIQLLEHFLFLGVVSSKQTSLFCWTCASYQATDRNPSFVGLVCHINQQLKSGSNKRLSTPLVSPFNPSVLPFWRVHILKSG